MLSRTLRRRWPPRQRAQMAHARPLNDGAEAPSLTTGRRAALLRNAEDAERQARRRLRTVRVR